MRRGETLVRLKAAFARARGNVVRVRELLADEGLEVALRHFDPPGPRRRFARPAPRRAGEYDFCARPGDAA